MEKLAIWYKISGEGGNFEKWHAIRNKITSNMYASVKEKTFNQALTN